MSRVHTGRIIWIDKTVAERDGVNLDRLRMVLDDARITLVYGTAVELPGGRVICPGCNEIRIRDRETWEPSVIASNGWRPVCRVCDGSTLSDHPEAIKTRTHEYAVDPGLRTRPAKPSKRVRERELGLVENSDKKRVRNKRSAGRFGSGGF